MHNLRELQKQFQAYILAEHTAIFPEITQTHIPIAIRLSIYRDAYFLRLLEALEQDFEVLHALIGDAAFQQLAQQYSLMHPSHFRSIRWFGGKIPSYLQQMPSFKNQDLCVEMATFEWLLTEAFDESTLPSIELATMATIPPDKWAGIRFKLHPSVRRVNQCWNIVAIWNAYKEKKQLITAEKNTTITHWLIWRDDIITQFCSLSPEESFFIDSMLDGINFGMICEGLCEWVQPEEVASYAAQLLKRFILDHLIVEIII